MKITRQRNSRKQNNTVLTEKTFTMTETGLTPEQGMDILFGKIMSGFFEVWESGPKDFTLHFHLDPKNHTFASCTKVDGNGRTAQNALPFALDGQQTVRLGISFSKKTRNIDKVPVG